MQSILRLTKAFGGNCLSLCFLSARQLDPILVLLLHSLTGRAWLCCLQKLLDNESMLLVVYFNAYGDVSGSDKNTAFRLPARPGNDSVLVFESPINMMSYCTLQRRITSNAVALCGLHDGALETYLRDNPNLKEIILCFDVDEPGQEASFRLAQKYKQKGYQVSMHVPSRGKDWNEYLQLRRQTKVR